MTEQNTKKQSKNLKQLWGHDEQTENVIAFEKASEATSQHQWCENNNVPRTTLQYWLKRKKNLNAHPKVIIFFESEVGLAFLHRIIIAAIFAFTKVGNSSIHNMVTFLELSSLGTFVASSYGK